MSSDAESFIVQAWSWMKANDLPNWVVVVFTAIVWPLVLFYWSRRKMNNIAGLDVRLVPYNMLIARNPHDAIAIDFINHTGSVTYLSGARILRCSSLFSVPIDASRDIAEGSYELNFMNEDKMFVHREITLQTNQSARTCMAINSPLPESFYTYRAPRYRRLFRIRKYFVLEYTAMVGTARYFVATLY
jgi:hypothetical protein